LRPAKVTVRLGDQAVAARHQVEGSRCTLTLAADVVVPQGGSLRVVLE
jgi:hypothetical protein